VKAVDVPFSIPGNSLFYGSSSGPATPICFLGHNAWAPNYLLPYYLAVPGTTVGSCPTPMPFLLSGVVRFLNVDRGAGQRDYLYQLVNTTADGAAREFFRFNVGGFNPSEVLSVGQVTSLAGLIAGTGSGFVPGSYQQGATLQAATSADRAVATPGSVGFDFASFPSFLGSPANLEPGEASAFFVLRTSRTFLTFDDVGGEHADLVPDDVFPFEVAISGGSTAVVIVTPEPGADVLAGVGAGALVALRRRGKKEVSR
jgi:hypothetical protein